MCPHITEGAVRVLTFADRFILNSNGLNRLAAETSITTASFSANDFSLGVFNAQNLMRSSPRSYSVDLTSQIAAFDGNQVLELPGQTPVTTADGIVGW
jgi:hypothetical protein